MIRHVCSKCRRVSMLPPLRPHQGYGAWCGACAAEHDRQVRDFERGDAQSQVERQMREESAP